MAVDIKKLIAAINPDLYCDSKLISEIKAIVKKDGYLKAAEKANFKQCYDMLSEIYRVKGDAKKSAEFKAKKEAIDKM